MECPLIAYILSYNYSHSSAKLICCVLVSSSPLGSDPVNRLFNYLYESRRRYHHNMAAASNGAAAAANGADHAPVEFKLKFCTVCASNQNRYAFHARHMFA